MTITIDKLECTIDQVYYSNGKIALLARDASDGEPYVKLTHNIPAVKIEDDEIFLNVKEIKDIEEIVEKYNLAENTGKSIRDGYILYPLYKINKPILSQYTDLD